MLVLSRRPKETIEFPNLGISVEILRVAGRVVKVGVDAPADIKVIRGELAQQTGQPLVGRSPQASNAGASSVSEFRHEIRNRLNSARLALHLSERLVEAGRSSEASESLKKALEAFSDLNQIASSTPSATPSPSATPHAALVVEDDANERELFAGLLRMDGYEVDAVENGAEAIAYLETNENPDVVLLDMQMPRMSGRETIQSIRKMRASHDIKVFAVSGMEPPNSGVPIGENGVDGWFQKPIEPQQFTKRLRAELVA